MNALLTFVRRYGTAAWRYRWGALAFSWVICGVGWIAITFIPNQYEASARLYVDTDAVLTPLLRGIAIDNAPASEVEMLQRTLLSRPNLQKLISQTDLDLLAPTSGQREWLVQKLSTAIRIQPQERNLFSIVYRNPNPKLAYDVVKTITTLFIESATGSNRAEIENAQQFLQQQLTSYEQQLRAAEKRRAEFHVKYVDLLPDSNGGASRLDQARLAVQSLQGDLQDAVAKRNMLAQELKTIPALLVTDSEFAAAGLPSSSPLAEAERNLQELRLRFTERHPDVVAARALVEALKRSGGGGAGRAGVPHHAVSNPVYEQTKLRLIDAEGTVTSLQRRVGDAQKERDRLEAIALSEPGVQAEYLNIDRDYSVLKKNYEELLARRESTKIAAAADIDADKVKLRIIDPPEIPRNPVAPKRGLLMSGVLLAGMAGGVGLAFLLVQLDQSFYTVQDLRGLGLPVLGGISSVRPPTSKSGAFAVLTFGIGVLLLLAIFSGLLAGSLPLPKFV